MFAWQYSFAAVGLLHKKFCFILLFQQFPNGFIHFLEISIFHREKVEYFLNIIYPWGVYTPEVKKGMKNGKESGPSE